MFKIRKSSITILFNAIIIFILTLENHDITRLAVAVPFLIALAFLEGVHLNKKRLTGYFTIQIFILLMSLASYFGLFAFKENMGGGYKSFDFFLNTSLKLSFVAILLLCQRNILNIIQAVTVVLVFHVMAFYIQFVVVYTSGFYIDLLYPFTGEVARYTWGVSLPFIGQTFRPTGFYNEPSTLFYAALALFVIRYISTRKTDWLFYLTIAMFFLSLSFVAIAVTLLFWAFYTLHKRRYLAIIPSFLVLLVIAVFSQSMLEERMEHYDATGIRANFISVLLSQSVMELAFGNGPVGVPTEIEFIYQTDEALSRKKTNLPALNDNGVLVSFLMSYGFIGCILLLLFTYRYSRSSFDFVCLSLVFLTKIKPVGILFLFYLLMLPILYNSNRSKRVE